MDFLVTDFAVLLVMEFKDFFLALFGSFYSSLIDLIVSGSFIM